MARPAGLAILEYLTDGHQATATECAAVCGLSASATSYHLRELAKAGLLEEGPSRGDARERVWRAPVGGNRIDTDDASAGRRTPAAVRGRVFGTFAAVGNGASMIGYAVGGALMPVASPRAIIAGTGIAGLLVGAVFLVPMVLSIARKRIGAEPAAAFGYRAEP